MRVHPATAARAANEDQILTPKPPATPRINGANIFGVRPGSPFLYRIPATGDRPMEFSADGLPTGLSLDAATGQITGSIKEPGKHTVTLKAKNSKGTNEKKFRIVVGDDIAEEGIRYLQAINFKDQGRTVSIAAE